jgi:RNA polymerase sigma factor (sigma-70 family)
MTSEPPRAKARSNAEELGETVRSAAAGDHLAWNRLIQEFAGMIWAIARAHRLSDADAADVSQSTWVKCLEQLQRIRDPTRIGAWLATTARRECLRVLRSSRRQGPWGADVSECESPDMTAQDALVLAARDEALWRGFSRLRQSDQSLLRLLVADPPMTYEEISAALEIPIGSIGPTRARALERLRGKLDQAGDVALIND